MFLLDPDVTFLRQETFKELLVIPLQLRVLSILLFLVTIVLFQQPTAMMRLLCSVILTKVTVAELAVERQKVQLSAKGTVCAYI